MIFIQEKKTITNATGRLKWKKKQLNFVYQEPHSLLITFSFNVCGGLKEQKTREKNNKKEKQEISYGLIAAGVISIGSLFFCRRESSATSDSRNNSFHGRIDFS